MWRLLLFGFSEAVSVPESLKKKEQQQLEERPADALPLESAHGKDLPLALCSMGRALHGCLYKKRTVKAFGSFLSRLLGHTAW